MTSLLASKDECIDALALADFALMPLSGHTKIPKLKGWTAIRPDPMCEPNDFPENYGVILSDSVMVIDVDPRKFREGTNPFEDLKTHLGLDEGAHFDTFTVRSRENEGGQDGLHIYFKKPEGISVRAAHASFPGVEFKSQGTFLVGPGSIHPDTNKPYTCVHGTPYELIDAPDVLLQILDRAQIPDTGGLDEYTDDEHTQVRFRDYLIHSAPIAVEHHDGDPTTFNVACMGRDFNLSPGATLGLMLSQWNDRCTPPWSVGGLRQKVINAYSYATGAQGSKHPSAIFDPLPEPDSNELRAQKIQHDRRVSEKKANIYFDGKEQFPGDENLAPVYKSFKNSVANIFKFFETPHYGEYTNPLYKLIGYNCFSRSIEFLRPAPWHKGTYDRAWTDADYPSLRLYFSIYKAYNPPTEALRDAVGSVADRNTFDSIADAWNVLKWDGVPRLSKLFGYYVGSPDNIYTEALSRCTVIAMVARNLRKDRKAVMNGVKHDMVPVMEGSQGIGKSQFCQILAGGEGYHNVVRINTNQRDSDNVQQMDNLLVAELAESLATKRSDIESVKAFVTTAKDRYRPAYGRLFQSAPRRSILIATVNPSSNNILFMDKTGNRRWPPVVCDKIRLEELTRDREQIIAEAVAAFKSDEKHYFTDLKVIEFMDELTSERTVTEPWADLIREWIEHQDKQGRYYDKLNKLDITRLLGVIPRDMGYLTDQRVSNAMKELGWGRARVRTGGKGHREYVFVRPVNLEDTYGDYIEGV